MRCIGCKKLACLCLMIGLLSACGVDPRNNQDKHMAFDNLQMLYVEGYSASELAIRCQCSEDCIVSFYQDSTSEIDSAIVKGINYLSYLQKEGKIEPVRSLNLSSFDALWEIHKKTQKLPYLSLYTDIEVTRLVKVLHEKRQFSPIDSLKVMIAYANMKYGLDTIPTTIPSFDKYFVANEGIKNIQVPQSYQKRSIGQLAKLDYYLWRAEQFELTANERLENSIRQKIESQVSASVEKYVESDINSLRNDLKYLFKNEEERDSIYTQKLIKRLALPSLSEDLKQEIFNYCVSINCSRAVLVDDLLGYAPLASNLNTTQTVALQDMVFYVENQNQLLNKRRGSLIPKSIASMLSWQLTKGMSFWKMIALDDLTQKTVNRIYQTLMGDEGVDEESLSEELTIQLYQSYVDGICSEIAPSGSAVFKQLLDDDAIGYYSRIRATIGL